MRSFVTTFTMSLPTFLQFFGSFGSGAEPGAVFTSPVTRFTDVAPPPGTHGAAFGSGVGAAW